MVLWSDYSCDAKLPAPGNDNLSANLLARAWNESTELQNAKTLGAAKKVAQKWSKSLLKC